MAAPDRLARESQLARPPVPEPSATRPLVPPLQPSAVYEVSDLDQIDALYGGDATGFIYARDGHPNARELASKLTALEGSGASLVCASGMAAEAAVALATLGAGAHVALSDGVYGRTYALFVRELARYGVEVDRFDAGDPATLAAVIGPKTGIVFAETLSNPLLRVADLPGLAEVAARHGALFVVDNTFAPLICRPLESGAGAVTHSLTKLIGGHSDLTLGALCGPAELIERVGTVGSTFGLSANPFDCWLCTRSLATLAVRSDRACATALALAGRLASHSRVRAVHYPGLAAHPDHDRAERLLSRGFGTIVTIDLGGRGEADRFIRRLSGIPFAPSLGDVATTLSHPATTSHRGQSAELWRRQGITPGLIRLSIGLECPDDLWKDLRHALDLI
jgi:cystathionine beta-lyase/cystathionine gamma-synthase